MGMAVEDRVAEIAVDRLFQAARAKERIDLGGLALDRLLDRRVVEHRDPRHPPQPGQRRLELQRLVHRLAHEVLDDLLAPGPERPLAEAAAKALEAREADSANFDRVPVQDLDTALGEDLLDLLVLAGLE